MKEFKGMVLGRLICAAIWETKVLFIVSFSHSRDPELHIF